ncbi:hypothetical protein GDO78_010961 [Eleutherodactylus coqui]|uniref:Uncharacterized protein n=1 Tax=Eleutherodactylus coqui TaxID=57060 RepID=A0A8J6F8H2_ELECQ|nr:hypothetical protein GDO78_010961 [Eleutherodactylus coqui]
MPERPPDNRVASNLQKIALLLQRPAKTPRLSSTTSPRHSLRFLIKKTCRIQDDKVGGHLCSKSGYTTAHPKMEAELGGHSWLPDFSWHSGRDPQ